MDRNPVVQKIAVRFAKAGDARWHSHHDLLRYWERAVRRAGLPVRLTEGFNPKPRLVFPHALGVGVAGPREEVEIELSRRLPLPDLAQRLARALAPTLGFVDISERPPTRKGHVVKRSTYLITGIAHTGEALRAAMRELLAAERLPVERGPADKRRALDARPWLENLLPAAEGAAVLVHLRHTAQGAGRIDEIAKLLAEKLGEDARDWTLEKTGMAFDA